MNQPIAGVDEAGRGPLAGPVYAAAVILGKKEISGLDDSKKVSPARRQLLEQQIKEEAICWNVASASVEEIDEINILQASMLAMRRAILDLSIQPGQALIDGNRIPSDLPCQATAIVGGDGIHAEISAASILVKEARDRIMRLLSQSYPQYGFDKHKGYPTKAHLEALESYGVCEHHRRSFGPVSRIIER